MTCKLDFLKCSYNEILLKEVCSLQRPLESACFRTFVSMNFFWRVHKPLYSFLIIFILLFSRAKFEGERPGSKIAKLSLHKLREDSIQLNVEYANVATSYAWYTSTNQPSQYLIRLPRPKEEPLLHGLRQKQGLLHLPKNFTIDQGINKTPKQRPYQIAPSLPDIKQALLKASFVTEDHRIKFDA